MSESISLTDAQAILAKLIEAQKNDPIGALTSITVNGRTYTFKSADDLIKMINYWTRIIADLKKSAARAPGFGRSVATFNC